MCWLLSSACAYPHLCPWAIHLAHLARPNPGLPSCTQAHCHGVRGNIQGGLCKSQPLKDLGTCIVPQLQVRLVCATHNNQFLDAKLSINRHNQHLIKPKVSIVEPCQTTYLHTFNRTTVRMMSKAITYISMKHISRLKIKTFLLGNNFVTETICKDYIAYTYLCFSKETIFVCRSPRVMVCLCSNALLSIPLFWHLKEHKWICVKRSALSDSFILESYLTALINMNQLS